MVQERRTFGQVLAAARQNKGLSQQEVAAQVVKQEGDPISPAYLSDIERDNRNPPALLLDQLADAVGLPREVLYFYAGLPSPMIRTIDPPVERIVAAYRAFDAALAGEAKG